MNIEIVEIEARQTYPLRHALLRKGMPLSSCHLEGDKAVETLHIGAFESETLVGILSAYSNPCPQYPNLKGSEPWPSPQDTNARELLPNSFKVFSKELKKTYILTASGSMHE
jgi:hypothetical protein